MKAILTILFIWLNLLASQACADLVSLPAEFDSALIQAGLPKDSVAVFVQAVDATEPIILHQAQKPMNPASVMKVVTAFAGLELLGPNYRWKTHIYADGAIENGVLHGDLYFQGHGDPSMMEADIWRLLNALRQKGVHEVRGNLYVDASEFASQYLSSGNFDGDGARAYNALPNAALINLNAVSFKFDADASAVSISATPEFADLKLNNMLKAGKGDCNSWRNRLAYDVKRDGGAATVTFSGVFPANCTEKYMELIVFDHVTYLDKLFKRQWIQIGGKFNGETRLQRVPNTARLIYTYESEALPVVLRDINKWSNNVMARQLLLTIASEKMSLPATESKGAQAIKNWLSAKNMNFDELVIENGSGLSRRERISAEHLGQLLVDTYRSPVMAELLSSLPIYALDGTMQRRDQQSELKGQAHLKTGSIANVYALAGYVLAKNKKRYAVVFIANHPKAALTKPAQDALLEWVYTQ